MDSPIAVVRTLVTQKAAVISGTLDASWRSRRIAPRIVGGAPNKLMDRVDTATPNRKNGDVGGSLEVRISDAERHRIVERLNQAYADGRITFDEHHERVDLALAALTKRDARAITSDLPRATGRRRRPQSRFRPPRLFLKANVVLWAIWGTEVLLGNTPAGDLWPLIVT